MALSPRQDVFSLQEVCALLGLSREDLQFLAHSRKIGKRVKGEMEDNYLFHRDDLPVLAVLATRLSRGRL